MKNRKGFTTVELVIVIAVIAILATVLIPTFSSLIGQANDSKALHEAKNAHTNYLIENGGTASEYMLYNADGRWVALKKGAPIGAYTRREEAVAALRLSEDKFVDSGDEKLWVYDENVVTNTDWSGASAVFVGDSITYGYGTTKTYYAYLKETIQLGTVAHKGISGSCYSAMSDYGTSNTPLINRYQNIPQNQDLIVIFMGTNDYGHDTPLGSKDDVGDVSFYGALNTILPAVQAANPNSQLVVVTPLHRYKEYTSSINGQKFTKDTNPNGRGHVLADYVDAIKAVCQRNDVPIIDLFTLFPLDPTDAQVRSEYMPDGLHPNAKGHEILAEIIAEELKKIPRKESGGATEDPEISEQPYIELRTGNKLDANYDNATNRACSTVNLYLTKETLITFKCSETYQWVMGNTGSIDGETRIGKYLPNDQWNSDLTCKVVDDGWYGFSLKRKDDADFALGSVDSKNLWDYFDISVPVVYGNKLTSTMLENTNRLSARIYLSAGTTITFEFNTSAGWWALAKNQAASNNPVWLTGGWADDQTWTITESGIYYLCLKEKNDSAFADPSTFDLFDFFEISGYPESD